MIEIIFEEKSVTDRILYEKLKRFEKIGDYSGGEICLDFEYAQFIKGGTLTKLCCFADNCKRNNINLYIKPSFRIAEYLADLGFWDIAKNNSMFLFDERFIDFRSNRNNQATKSFFRINKIGLENKYKNKFEFPSWATDKFKFEVYVTAEILGYGNAGNRGTYTKEFIPEECKAVLKTIGQFKAHSENVEDDMIIRPIIQIIHNSVWHSQGTCYFFAQTSTYSKSLGDRKWVGVDISVADSGIGLYSSLICKDDKDQDFRDDNFKLFGKSKLASIKNRHLQNVSAIPEALLFRMGDGQRGLYHIVYDMTKENSTKFKSIIVTNNITTVYLGEGIRGWKEEIVEKDDMSRLLKYAENSKDEILDFIKSHSKDVPDIGIGCSVDISMTNEISKG